MHGIDFGKVASQSASGPHLYTTNWFYISGNLCQRCVCCCLPRFLEATWQKEIKTDL